MIETSIIIVNYKTCDLIINSINSIIKQTANIDYEIIVIDNNSEDNSAEQLNKIFGNKVQYIALDQNIGFGGANNQGMSIAQGRNFLLLNPDTLLNNNAIKILSDFLDSTPEAGVVGGNLFYEDGTPQPSFRCQFTSLSSKWLSLIPIPYWGSARTKVINSTERIMQVKTIYGACFMVKREVYEQTTGFDPRFFMYGEEEEWCLRINKTGYKAFNIPQAHITHLEGKSFAYSEHRTKRMMDGNKTYYQICFTPKQIWKLRQLDKLIAISRIVGYWMIGKKERVSLWKYIYKNSSSDA